MSADGDVLAEPQGRDVADFEKTLTALKRWQELDQKEERSQAEDVELFLAELDLGKLSHDEAKAKFEKLEGFSDEQKKRVENELIALEFKSILESATRETQDQVPGKVAAMAEAGRVPEGDSAGRFWQIVSQHASTTEDVALFEKALGKLEEVYADEPRAERFLDGLRKRLEELKAGEEKDG